MSTRWPLILVGILACLSLAGIATAQGPQPESVSQIAFPYEGTASTTGTAFTVTNTGAGAGAAAIAGRSDNGYAGLVGYSAHRYGVFGISVSPNDAGIYGRNDASGIGVLGRADSGIGVWGRSVTGAGVRGESQTNHGAYLTSAARDFAAVWGEHVGSNVGHGVVGVTPNGQGVRGVSYGGDGVLGIGTTVGVRGTSTNGLGVYAESSNTDSFESKATATDKSAIYAHHDGSDNAGNAIYAVTDRGYGIQSVSERGTGIYTEGRRGGDGVEAYVTGDGVASTPAATTAISASPSSRAASRWLEH